VKRGKSFVQYIGVHSLMKNSGNFMFTQILFAKNGFLYSQFAKIFKLSKTIGLSFLFEQRKTVFFCDSTKV